MNLNKFEHAKKSSHKWTVSTAAIVCSMLFLISCTDTLEGSDDELIDDELADESPVLLQTADGLSSPTGWTCDIGWFDTNDGCDCGCGVLDPDCDGNQNESACYYHWCDEGTTVLPDQNYTCDAPQVNPGTWSCNGLFYGTDDGCDCGCGIPDPDCGGISDDSVCEYTYCPTENRVDPSDNSQCDPTMVGMTAAMNQARASEGAGLDPFSWDATLAAESQDWAEHLVATIPHATINTDPHSLVYQQGIGENIMFIGGSRASVPTNKTEVTNIWMAEKSCYTFDAAAGRFKCDTTCTLQLTYPAGGCGHYTQLVSPYFSKLGCGEASASGYRWLVCRFAQ